MNGWRNALGFDRSSRRTRLVRLCVRTVAGMADDDIARAIERQVNERFDRHIEIPDGLTEDEGRRICDRAVQSDDRR
jgi:hypothetical protein